MLGMMQDWPLLIPKIIDHAAQQHREGRVISRSVEGPMHEIGYPELRARALRLAKRLERDGIGMGDRVATLAWNTWRHLESWYGITGIGAIYHTINPRLFADQIVYIANHAGDRVMFLDLTFVPMVEKLQERLPTIERFVILSDPEHMPQSNLRNAVAYEDYIAEADADFRWRTFDENTAAGLCYTSGTTGHPKGVLYSHRSNVLHALSMLPMDAFGLSAHDRMLPIVPLYHANSWSLAFSAPMSGATMVMPGAKLDGASIYDIIEQNGVTCSAAVPTVWLNLLNYLEQTGKPLSKLKRVFIGGSACPRAIIEAFEVRYGVNVVHAWGMTEMSPVGAVCSIKPSLGHLNGETLYDLKMKQGHAHFTVEMKIENDKGEELPWDGKTFGRLKVRGPTVIKGYFRGDGGDVIDADGFFDTGDIATIDPSGYMQITDRAKDVIKSGGEWISSIDLENLAVGHPEVAEAAVIGVVHPKWDERPLLVVVPKTGMSPNRESILAFMEGKIARWWMPDDVVFVPEIPHTATGKIHKTTLREQFKDFRFSVSS